MSDSTDLQNIHRILDLSSETSERNSARCRRQFVPLFNQRLRLVGLRQKLAKRRRARAEELRVLRESLGLTTSIPIA